MKIFFLWTFEHADFADPVQRNDFLWRGELFSTGLSSIPCTIFGYFYYILLHSFARRQLGICELLRNWFGFLFPSNSHSMCDFFCWDIFFFFLKQISVVSRSCFLLTITLSFTIKIDHVFTFNLMIRPSVAKLILTNEEITTGIVSKIWWITATADVMIVSENVHHGGMTGF